MTDTIIIDGITYQYQWVTDHTEWQALCKQHRLGGWWSTKGNYGEIMTLAKEN